MFEIWCLTVFTEGHGGKYTENKECIHEFYRQNPMDSLYLI